MKWPRCAQRRVEDFARGSVRYVAPSDALWWRLLWNDWRFRAYAAAILTGCYIVPPDDYVWNGRWTWRNRRRWGVRPPEADGSWWMACTRSWRARWRFFWRGYP